MKMIGKPKTKNRTRKIIQKASMSFPFQTNLVAIGLLHGSFFMIVNDMVIGFMKR